jgi:hypothetical protein
MISTTSVMLAWSLIALQSPSAAPVYDGSRPLLCAAVEVLACEENSRACTREVPESVNLPPFLRIDAARRRIEATDGSNRGADIMTVATVDGRLLMQGAQNGRGWNLVVAPDSGRMSVAVAGDRVGYVVFGSCTNA